VTPFRIIVVGFATLFLVVVALATGTRFQADLALAAARATRGSQVIQTRCGPIEYQEAGSGIPLLAVHGSGGGHDQGMAFARPLTKRGIRVIAMSRFGYLRTPMRADASPAAQADAHVCLLDSLGVRRAAVLGGSAGAPSAIQMAIRHPERTSALILLVPLTYKPQTQAASAPAMSPRMESAMMSVIGSDFLFWSALHFARDPMIGTVLATPSELVPLASASEQARVNAMLDSILPVSARAQGLRSDTAIGKHLVPADLKSIRAPTLVISARDDRYGTFASAQFTAGQIAGSRFIGFASGGHIWLGHDAEVMAAITRLLKPAVAQPSPSFRG
jgi:2-hydroxy-6-oxonona-2,4-dienedioate hydrolase